MADSPASGDVPAPLPQPFGTSAPGGVKAPVPASGGIKFPVLTSSGPKPLVLRRRRGLTHSPFEISEASTAARETIRAVVAATRSPFPGGSGQPLDSARATELERSLRTLEASLA
ncbi:MAG TPA: hypothetical protein PLU52_10010, partial [Opitutaceae bacterium]|nr:hypothetical protein [Opitutaceae bacterium]